jgi:hypothetical protein
MRRQFLSQNGPGDTRIEERRWRLEQMQDLSKAVGYQRIGGGQLQYPLRIPVEQALTPMELPWRL